MPTSLPGVFVLVRKGVDIYRAHARVIGAIALLQAICAMAFALLEPLFKSLAAQISGGKFALIGSALILVVVVYVVQVVLSLMLIHAIRGADESLTLTQVFARARAQFWSFLWLMLLVMFIIAGVLIACMALLTVVFSFLIGQWGILVGALGFMVGAVVVGTWLSFSTFVLVDGDAKGMRAIEKSYRMAHKNFFPILGRFAGLAALAIIVGGAASLFIVLAMRGVGAGELAANAVGQGFSTLFLTPVFMAAYYTLYVSLKESVQNSAEIG